MLSICIPVYNFNISPLLFKLAYLLKESGIVYEIIIADDCSDNPMQVVSKEIIEPDRIKYIFLDKNIGRSAIRNLLCREAMFDTLLFLDCDSLIIDDNFILNYLPYLNTNMVIYGGRYYQKDKPVSPFLLHWKYGRIRETKPATIRNTFPTKHFRTNNFLISKNILKQIPFNNKLKGYGHEDTLMGIEFFNKNIPVLHIENPVLHAGLETNEKFLLKIEIATRNLCFLEKEVSDLKALQDHILIYKVFTLVKKGRLTFLIRLCWLVTKPLLILFIKSFSSMKTLDFYKLGFLCSVYKKSTAQ